MKVFISWSGELSKKLAEAFNEWLPSTLQSVQPYFTPSDIEKGDRWNSEIAKELESSDVGVLFLTRDNVASPWLLYEAGALTKRLEKSKVCPIIIGISNTDLSGPLRQFQATEFSSEDFYKLLRTVNSASGDSALKDSVLDEVFRMWWPRLEEKFNEILETAKDGGDDSPLRSDRDILEEVLQLSRLNAERVSRGGRISSRAVDDLAKSVVEAHRAIQGQIDPHAALTALEATKKPIMYFKRKASEDKKDAVSDAVEQLEALSFAYEPDTDDDDDIPF